MPASPSTLFSYGLPSRSAALPIYKVAELIPLDRKISLPDLHERVVQHIDRRATEAAVKQALWDLAVVTGLEIVPEYDGSYQIGHTDRSRRIVTRGGSEGPDAV